MSSSCACRPGCLTRLRPTDVTVPSAAGLVLTAHLQPSVVYPVDGLTSLTSALSKVRR